MDLRSRGEAYDASLAGTFIKYPLQAPVGDCRPDCCHGVRRLCGFHTAYLILPQTAISHLKIKLLESVIILYCTNLVTGQAALTMPWLYSIVAAQ
jgi:hypothetical protein